MKPKKSVNRSLLTTHNYTQLHTTIVLILFTIFPLFSQAQMMTNKVWETTGGIPSTDLPQQSTLDNMENLIVVGKTL